MDQDQGIKDMINDAQRAYLSLQQRKINEEFKHQVSWKLNEAAAILHSLKDSSSGKYALIYRSLIDFVSGINDSSKDTVSRFQRKFKNLHQHSQLSKTQINDLLVFYSSSSSNNKITK